MTYFLKLSGNPCSPYLLKSVVMEVSHEVIEMNTYSGKLRAFYAERLFVVIFRETAR